RTSAPYSTTPPDTEKNFYQPNRQSKSCRSEYITRSSVIDTIILSC
ncbi:hypothetical protein NPIL_61591, partial [Nephila pilipes]